MKSSMNEDAYKSPEARASTTKNNPTSIPPSHLKKGSFPDEARERPVYCTSDRKSSLAGVTQNSIPASSILD
jgi:hypothetical protein